ncbi:MAG: META domain-containing protein [Pyrinomonadaceae bacterium]|jgi:heat shock protein HslJ|nr:META domain-containing protein [Pyrinomonadaceae bacterium]
MKLFIFFSILFLTISVNAQNYVGKWKLTKLVGVEKLSEKITLNVSKDGKIGGNGGCNTFGGSYTVKKAKITFKDIFSTKMFCDGVPENEYFNALGNAKSYTIKKGELIIYDKSKKVILKFVKQ